jgi:dipeptide transport system substrate-binding protein
MLKTILKKYLSIGLAVGLALVSFGCDNQQQAQKTKEKTFIFASSGAPKTLAPSLGVDGFSLTAGACAVYNRLLEFKLGRTNIIAGLAEKWDVSDNSRIYRFHLRRGVKFHANGDFKPTRDFNADDVMFTLFRMMGPNHPLQAKIKESYGTARADEYNKVLDVATLYHNLAEGQYKYFKASGLDQSLQNIKKIDDYTVEIHLKNPDATFLATCAMPFLSMTSLEFAEYNIKAKTVDQFDKIPVGTGPFQFVKYIKDQTIRYKGNKDYWAGAPKIDNLLFVITPDEQVRAQKIFSGSVQAIGKPPVVNLEEYRSNNNLQLHEQLGQNTGYLSMNVSKKPFNDVRVRKAISMAINKKAIINTIFEGNAFEAVNLLPPVVWGHHDGIQPRAFDPAAAKALLKEAGFDENNPLEFTLMAMDKARPYNPDAKKMAEMIQFDLQEIGVKMHVRVMEWGQYLDYVLGGKHEACFLGWTSDTADPDNFLNVLLGCGNLESLNTSRWCNPEAQKLMDKAKKITDQAQRAELYKKVQEIIFDDVPLIPIAHAKVFTVTTSNVKNYVTDLFGLQFFHTVDIVE